MSSFVKMLLYVKTYGSVGECFPLLGLECNMIETFKTETNFLRLVKTFLSWLFIYIFSFGVEWSFEWNWSGPKSHSHHSVKKKQKFNSTRLETQLAPRLASLLTFHVQLLAIANLLAYLLTTYILSKIFTEIRVQNHIDRDANDRISDHKESRECSGGCNIAVAYE